MGEKELRQMIARAKESKCQGGVLPTNSRENVEKAPPGHRQLSQDTLKAKAARVGCHSSCSVGWSTELFGCVSVQQSRRKKQGETREAGLPRSVISMSCLV